MSKVAEIKTKENDLNVDDFINGLATEQKREDSRKLIDIMQQASGEEPKMWGSKIIGFGKKRYKSPSTNREVDWFKIGFSPRKTDFSLNLVLSLKEYENKLNQLGKHKSGVGCLYINKLADVDENILRELITAALEDK
ncbi:DUF1801 domain-containing protein [Pedobacter aquatilis]|uniref:DUF1801 domain-containing protein n=1 Tax=Pedobacter aquatilis TaxID=351343 RepID=UPI00292EC304|nr:DUF1801 domain-containing protein [Pedobacter aquatilis]